MICPLCGMFEGKHKVTSMDRGKYQDMYVCDECFKTLEKQSFRDSFTLLMMPLLAMSEAMRQQELHTSVTKLSESNCPECYELFKTFMLPMIQSIHRTYHVPKTKKTRTRMEELQGKLRKAVNDQRFEDAAKLRDEIHNLENGINTDTNTNGSSKPGPA